MSFINSLYKIAIILTARDKKKLIGLVFLSFIITLVETVGIFSIVPFIAIVSNPAVITTGYYMKLYDILGFTSIQSFLILFGFILTGFFILRGVYSILHSYLLNSYVFGVFRSISLRLFQNYISMPYSDFANRNSAELTKSITSEAMYFSFILQYLLFFLSDIMILVCFYIVLLLVNIKATLVLTVVLGVKVFALTRITSKIMRDEGVKRESFDKRLYKILSETFGNFKFIKMLPDKKNILKKMSDISEQITKTQTTYNIFIDDIAITNENIKDWRQKIGYIPQSIYLFDGTVAENVCFGIDYDEQNVIKALKKANIYDFLGQKEGLNTLVGENGIKLSGGQKQRIGIARALYSN